MCLLYRTLSTRVSADGKLNFRSMLMRILCLLPLTSLASRCWSCHHFWGLQVNGHLPPVLRASSSRKPRGRSSNSSSSSGSKSIMASWSPAGEARHAFVRIFYELNSFASPAEGERRHLQKQPTQAQTGNISHTRTRSSSIIILQNPKVNHTK